MGRFSPTVQPIGVSTLGQALRGAVSGYMAGHQMSVEQEKLEMERQQHEAQMASMGVYRDYPGNMSAAGYGGGSPGVAGSVNDVFNIPASSDSVSSAAPAQTTPSSLSELAAQGGVPGYRTSDMDFGGPAAARALMAQAPASTAAPATAAQRGMPPEYAGPRHPGAFNPMTGGFDGFGPIVLEPAKNGQPALMYDPMHSVRIAGAQMAAYASMMRGAYSAEVGAQSRERIADQNRAANGVTYDEQGNPVMGSTLAGKSMLSAQNSTQRLSQLLAQHGYRMDEIDSRDADALDRALLAQHGANWRATLAHGGDPVTNERLRIAVAAMRNQKDPTDRRGRRYTQGWTPEDAAAFVSTGQLPGQDDGTGAGAAGAAGADQTPATTPLPRNPDGTLTPQAIKRLRNSPGKVMPHGSADVPGNPFSR